MLSSPNKPHTAPDRVSVVQHAFDAAYRESLVGPVVLFDRRSVRYDIAERVIAAVLDNGERDQDRLKAYALAGLAP